MLPQRQSLHVLGLRHDPAQICMFDLIPLLMILRTSSPQWPACCSLPNDRPCL